MNLFHKPFYFIRHGETNWNKYHIAMGQQDIPLNEQGIKQTLQAAQLLKKANFASIAVSPMTRAVETAHIIAKEIPTPITIIEDLKECCWGIMEGKSKGNGDWVKKWRNDDTIEGAELFSSFTIRVMQGLAQALILPAPVLIVSHGGVYWAIQKALSLSFNDLTNCIPVFHRPPESPFHPWFIYRLEKN